MNIYGINLKWTGRKRWISGRSELLRVLLRKPGCPKKTPSGGACVGAGDKLQTAETWRSGRTLGMVAVKFTSGARDSGRTQGEAGTLPYRGTAAASRDSRVSLDPPGASQARPAPPRPSSEGSAAAAAQWRARRRSGERRGQLTAPAGTWLASWALGSRKLWGRRLGRVGMERWAVNVCQAVHLCTCYCCHFLVWHFPGSVSDGYTGRGAPARPKLALRSLPGRDGGGRGGRGWGVGAGWAAVSGFSARVRRRLGPRFCL